MNRPQLKTPFAAALDIRFVGAVQGRYLLPDSGSTNVYSCRSSSLSPFSVVIAAPVMGRLQERVVLRLDQLGTLTGSISQIVPGSFRAEIIATDEERLGIAAKINWLKRRSLRQADNKRAGQRMQPRDPKGYLYVGDAEQECFIIDVSPSGIAISSRQLPAIGTPVSVGGISGRVVRQMEGGVGIQFDEAQPVDTLFEAIAARRSGTEAGAAD